MPYTETPYGTGRIRYYDPIKIYEERGLKRVVREPMAFWQKNFMSLDKYDIFAEYPFLEKVDYNRLVFETYHGIKQRNDIATEEYRRATGWDHYAYCCFPTGCVLNAAMGATMHWTWRAAFEKQLPYWDIRESYVK